MSNDTANKNDKYAEAVAYLTAHPEQIHESWNSGYMDDPKSPGAVLFRVCTRYKDWCHDTRVPDLIGCLTQVRSGMYVAQTPELTELIKNDKQLPSEGISIRVEHLERFAYWNRIMDETLPTI